MSEQLYAVDDAPVVPGAVQVHTRAIGQYPQWARQQAARRRQEEEQAQQQQQAPVQVLSAVVVECAVVEQPAILAAECIEEASSDLTEASVDEHSSTTSQQEPVARHSHSSKNMFSRVFRKSQTSKRDSAIPLTSPENKIPDNPMDVNPRKEVAMHNMPRRPFQEIRPVAGSRRNVMRLMRGLSSRGQFLLDRVKEIFPHADEDRVVTLQKQGVSVQTIVGMFADESANATASTEDTSTTSSDEESGRSEVSSFAQHLRSAQQQAESARVMQIMEVFPNATRSVIMEQLEHSSVEHIISDLVDQSLTS
jgi:hypothetical protein